MYVLVSDVGATNTRIAVAQNETIYFSQQYPTSTITDFCATINDFLSEAASQGYTTHQAIFAVAGAHNPVSITLTHQDLTVNKQEILARTALQDVSLYNDVYALAKSTGQVVISAGTGLGVASPTTASQAGHLLFAPITHTQRDLCAYIQSQIRRPVEYEDVLCAAGWVRIYSYLQEKQFVDAPRVSRPQTLSMIKTSTACSQKAATLYKEICSQFQEQIKQVFVCSNVLLSGGVFIKNPFLRINTSLDSDKEILLLLLNV